MLTLSIVKTDFPFFNGALIIYASIYFIAFLIYFALTRLRECGLLTFDKAEAR